MWIMKEAVVYTTLFLLTMVHTANARCLVYLTGQHNNVPPISQLSEITHVTLAFLPSTLFNSVPPPTEWNLFTSIPKVRSQFPPGVKVMVAIGGWGDTAGFSAAASNETTRSIFARNIKAMLDSTGADGVDIDWEYPGGNSDDYKSVPNSQKAWEISAYPLLLSTLRSVLGPSLLISAAVPGLQRDMLAFTPSTIPLIVPSLDFMNIMTYDLMNRRDNVTKHHTGLEFSRLALQTYINNGVPKEKALLGLAFYVKWFRTSPSDTHTCETQPVGCKTALMEDPETGKDLGKAGQFAWSDDVPTELKASFQKAMEGQKYDNEGGGTYYWEGEEDLWWSWEEKVGIERKFKELVKDMGLGGVFAWGLGEDGPEYRHLSAMMAGARRYLRTETKKGEDVDLGVKVAKGVWKDEL